MTTAKNERDPETSKKAYQKPTVQVFGDFTTLTQAINGNNMMDGVGSGPAMFTS